MNPNLKNIPTMEIWDYAPVRPIVPSPPANPLFSFFKSPITNTQPHSRASLRQIYNAIRGDYYKPQTDKLRELCTGNARSLSEVEMRQIRKFKAQNFDYCTFSGIFTTRSNNAMLSHSGLMCFDFDHIADLNKLRFDLLTDEFLNTQLLFTSPSGHGLKWIIAIEPNPYTHADYFHAIEDYLIKTYNAHPDKSGKDLSRACFLPYDPHAYINSIHLKN
jgi:hypothetical protein